MALIVGSKEAAKHERLNNILSKATPAKAATWIDNNVTDLPSAKAALKHMARLLVAVNKRLEELE